MNKRLFSGLMLFYLTLNFFSCVILNSNYPEGGPKDTNPPVLISSYPKDGSTFFSGKKIKLVFDKDVKLHNVRSELVILPLLIKNEENQDSAEVKRKETLELFDFKVKNKTITINLKKDLKKDHTYTFNFQNSIVDLTEGNVAKDLTLTFSTGEKIDLNCISGCVKNIMTSEPLVNSFVALYNVKDGGNLLDDYPQYFTKTDNAGNFKLSNIADGEYFIYASDKLHLTSKVNMNFINCGVYADVVKAEGTIENINIYVQNLNFSKFEILKEAYDDKYFDLHFSKPVNKYIIKSISDHKESKQTIPCNLINDKKTLRFYNTRRDINVNEPLNMAIEAWDEYGNSISKEFGLLLVKQKTSLKKEQLKHSVTSFFGENVKNPLKLQLTLNKPLLVFKLADANFTFANGDKLPILEEDITFNEDMTEIYITKDISNFLSKQTDKNEPYSLIKLNIPEKTFFTVDEDSLPKITSQYNFIKQEDLGTIRGRVATLSPGFIIQLLDNNLKVLSEIKNKTEYEFSGLIPGEYIIRILCLNAPDAEWYCGDIKNKIMPNKVILYPYLIKLLPKWEINDINFNF
jgi:hypothetical protein